ncbi:MAG: transcription termination/antitermination protein NusG [Candidatus Margulisiibacteriota bacterium]
MEEEKREGSEEHKEENKPSEMPAEESQAADLSSEAQSAKEEEQAPVEAQPEETKEEQKDEEVSAETPKEAVETSPVEEKPEEAPPGEEKPLDVARGKEEEKPEEKAKPAGERRWYVIQALTGQEDRVKRAIDLTIKSTGLQDKVFQVLVPTEETVEIKGGKRVEKVKKMFPGYVFLEMILDDESWYHMRQTPGVARFIGTKVKPTPVSGKEMQRVLKQLGKEEKLLEITFEKGEGVRIISGPFRGYTGTVDEVNAEKGKLKILINIFGRDTPVEVNFEHAQKMI